MSGPVSFPVCCDSVATPYKEKKQMDIAKLGEFGLIDHLTKDIKPQNESTRYGVGDDCAVLHYPQSEVLVTSDMLMEGIHFDLTYISMQHLGYKSAMVNISDIFAMNGTPRQLIVSIALSKRFTVEDLEDFYRGLRAACEKWNVDIVGGDTTSSYTGLAISITCIGEAASEDIVYRKGAHDTDLVCVSGDLGAAYMGLQLLEREKAVYYGQVNDLQKKIAEAKAANDTKRYTSLQEELASFNFQPDFAGKEYLLQRQLEPDARGDIIARLHQAGIRPTAMMDISDGLSSELLHICKQSGVGCRIYEKNLPIDYQTAVMAEEMNLNVTTCAMNGGEDYELLFTVPIGDHEKIQDIDGIRLIGHITKPELGTLLVTRDNQEFTLQAQGWNPLKG
jgi:thiamine-monophosphate kinase